ncbi:MAG: alpha-amylase family glycosyl hydrolase [Polyangiales bacterium]
MGEPRRLALEGDGIFSATVAAAHAGSHYHFTLTTPAGTLTRTDPWCRERASGADCSVIDPTTFSPSHAGFVAPARSNSVVYEADIGALRVATGATLGTFTAAVGALSDLHDLGVDVLELMPVHACGGAFGSWGYGPQLYLSPRSEYGTADDLRALVDDAHGAGMSVWLDVVFNHMDGWSKAPLHCFDGNCPSGWAGLYYFAPGTYATTPWGPRPDYTSTRVAEMLLGSVDEWIDEFHGDGFRFDSVANIRAIDGAGTTPGGQEFLVQANAEAHARSALTVAEDLKGDDAITADPSTGGFGFDAQWDGFGYEVVPVLTAPTDAARDLGAIESALTGSYNGDPFARLMFLEDHDTVGNGGARLPDQIDSADPTSLHARRVDLLGATLLLTAPGVPMIFMGEESLATGTFDDPPSPLATPTAQGLQVRAFWKDAIALRTNTAGGTGGLSDMSIDVFHRNDGAKVIAYRRYGTSGEDVIVILNLMNKSYASYDIGAPAAGPWRVRLTTDSAKYGDDFPVTVATSLDTTAASYDGMPFKLGVPLTAYGAMILSK